MRQQALRRARAPPLPQHARAHTHTHTHTHCAAAGEILPQAVCSRHGLSIGGHAAPAVRVLMWLSAPVSWPIAKSLDWLLGAEQPLFGKRQISALVDLHRCAGVLLLWCGGGGRWRREARRCARPGGHHRAGQGRAHASHPCATHLGSHLHRVPPHTHTHTQPGSLRAWEAR
jgi:hypothetical protein